MKISKLTAEKITDEIVDKVLYEGLDYKNEKIDVSIVLGSSKAHIYRLPYAIDAYKKGLISKIIVSGGRGIGIPADISEGEFLKEKAIEECVKEDDIIVEDRAMTTLENMEYSLQLIKENNILAENMVIAIVTSSFHMRRSMMLAKRVFNDKIRIIPLPGEDNSTRRTTWFTNEQGRTRAFGEVKKLMEYVQQVNYSQVSGHDY